MTDPWSVHFTKNDIIPENSIKEQEEIDTDNQLVNPKNESQTFGFEDSFIQNNNFNKLDDTITEDTSDRNCEHKPLPDSESYLKSLERKLEKLKKSSKLVDALSEKRNDCMRSMLQDNLTNAGCNNDLLLELEASLTNSDSAVQNLYRQIQPIQAVTVGETVHIVNYDQLEQQRVEQEDTTAEEEYLPASR